MIIAFDLHGVITSDPKLYKSIMETLCQINDIKVLVISGPKKDQVEKELHHLGFKKGQQYNDILSVVDYLLDKKENYEKV